LVKAAIRREKYAAFKSLARSVAYAYQQHPSRLEWSAYATVAGPSLNVYVLIPLAGIEQMDRITSLDRVMADVYGPGGAERLGEFQDCVVDMSTAVLNRIHSGVGPAGPFEMPAEYLYYADLKLHPPKAAGFLNGVRRIAASLPQSPFSVYGTFAGPTRVHCFAMGDQIGDLEVVGRLQAQIASGYGEDEAAEIMADVNDALTETETSILRHIGHQAA
jgi:hypothetical protein